jgi:hypothetical protein
MPIIFSVVNVLLTWPAELLIGIDHMLTDQEMNTKKTMMYETTLQSYFGPLQPHMILGCEPHPVCEGSGRKGDF